jgi:hypothetical protein
MADDPPATRSDVSIIPRRIGFRLSLEPKGVSCA